jgi:hypothetical protein
MDHEGADLTNGLLQLWIHSFMDYEEVETLAGGDLLEEAGQWGMFLYVNFVPSNVLLLPLFASRLP